MPPWFIQYTVAVGVLILALSGIPASADHSFYLIRVIDAATGSPVGCATLQTTNGIVYTSDDNGHVALYEPGLMGTDVYFSVERDGYLAPTDVLGRRGVSLTPVEGDQGFIWLSPDGAAAPCSAGDLATRLAAGPVPSAAEHFEIEVVDEATGRGIPLVEVRSPGSVDFTDSSGRVAFYDLDRMGEELQFEITSQGYDAPPGELRLVAAPGGYARIELQRRNIAERLYRITGAGTYVDSVILDYAPPIAEPLLNTGVVGQDSVLSALYQGQLFWVWGDTRKYSYPLGNFRATAATSELPTNGGLDPEVGIDLHYFANESGEFVKEMAPVGTVPNPTPDCCYLAWLDGLIAVPEVGGEEQLLAIYRLMQGWTVSEQGIVRFDDDLEVFEKVMVFGEDDHARPERNAFLWRHDDQDFVYYGNGVRVPAREDALLDASEYEAWTPLEQGSATSIERDSTGDAVYAWKARTLPISVWTLKLGIPGLEPEDLLLHHLRDPDTGIRMNDQSDMITWNPYRGRFVRILTEEGGSTSILGETWYAEGDTPMGPWVYGRKIVTHDLFSFYNPHHNPLFDRDGGRILYFEGTYTNWLTEIPATPRYDYNQIMYRLDLDDERLVLPVPVYDLAEEALPPGDFATKRGLRVGTLPPVASFFAMDRPAQGLVPVYRSDPSSESAALRAGGEPTAAVRFHALPADSQELPPDAVPLNEFVHETTGVHAYSVQPEIGLDGFVKSPEPLAWVWQNPIPHGLPVKDYLCPGSDDSIDTDGDGMLDHCDVCPIDTNDDSDGDGICDSDDICIGHSDLIDSDGDDLPDACDACSWDPSKTEPGICGCGVSDLDSDGDGTADCDDLCASDPNKTEPGVCGCGVSDLDSDGDGTADCDDLCASDPNKTEPGGCGCNVSDLDSDGDGVADCDDVCSGADDNLDTDGDDTPDDCDPCPLDNPDDLNDDGICDSLQVPEPGSGLLALTSMLTLGGIHLLRMRRVGAAGLGDARTGRRSSSSGHQGN